jgi:hypothetical protein
MENSLRVTVIILLLAVSNLSAATLMVGPGGLPTIQQAVDAAAAGDEIVVTNGIYATGTAPGGANVMVTWQSVAGENYFLTRSQNLASPFTLVATNIVGQAGTTSYADTNATGAGPLFYRVGVRTP